MKIVLGADHRGADACQYVAEQLQSAGHEVRIVGHCNESGSCDYPDVAFPVAGAVSQGDADFGILICGSGIGMSIAANKVRGVRAALVHDELGAQLSRLHNDANVLCLSGDMLGLRIIDRIVQTFCQTGFEGGRHARRLSKVAAIEAGCDPSTVKDAETSSEGTAA